MKKTSSVVISLLLASPVYGETPIIETLIQDDHEFRYTDNLIINIDDGMKVITNKCEDEGVKDLRELLDKDDPEEAWAYIPETCTWIDVGKKQGLGNVTVDFDFIKSLGSQFNEIIIYHSHPKGDGMDYFLQALPTPQDVAAMIAHSTVMHKEHNGVKYRNKVISEHGIATYDIPTPEGDLAKLDELQRKVPDYGSVERLAYRLAGPYLFDVLIGCFPVGISNPQAAKERLSTCGQISEQFYKVTFTPFEN